MCCSIVQFFRTIVQFSFLWVIFPIVKLFLSAISWIAVRICEGIAWLYSFTWFLKFHACVTFAASFVMSQFWSKNLGIDTVSGPGSPLGCQFSVASAPSHEPHLGVLALFFFNFWHKYGHIILQTAFSALCVVYAISTYLLVKHRHSPRLGSLRNALAPFGVLGQLKKSFIEVSILRLIVWISDVFCDPNQIDLPVFLTSLFAYLHFASVFKLMGVGQDFGWLDGLVSVILTSFEHFVRPWSAMQLLGILLTTFVLCYKNSMWSGHGQLLPQENAQELAPLNHAT